MAWWIMTVSAAIRGARGNMIGMAIGELHRSEHRLASALVALSDQQKAEHEIFHVAGDIAAWSDEHVRELAATGRRYSLELDPEPGHGASVVAAVRRASSEALGRLSTPGLLLLTELKRVHRLAAGTSLDWELLAQTAQAVKDVDLLALAQDCHPQTLRQMRWANAKLKEISPQIMASS
jgi:hypothetical protein